LAPKPQQRQEAAKNNRSGAVETYGFTASCLLAVRSTKRGRILGWKLDPARAGKKQFRESGENTMHKQEKFAEKKAERKKKKN